MNILEIICPDYIEDKLASKHNVEVHEAQEVLWSKPRVRFAEKGYVKANDIYIAFGQTFGGRYLSVFFIYKPETSTAIIVSARTMSEKERRSYGTK